MNGSRRLPIYVVFMTLTRSYLTSFAVPALGRRLALWRNECPIWKCDLPKWGRQQLIDKFIANASCQVANDTKIRDVGMIPRICPIDGRQRDAVIELFVGMFDIGIGFNRISIPIVRKASCIVITSRCLVSGVSEIVAAFVRCYGVERRSDAAPDVFVRSPGSLSHAWQRPV